jgi:flagellar hook-basal body complex protein FliE
VTIPIDPSMLTSGAEWQVGGVGGAQTPAEIESGAGAGADGVQGTGFGDVLSKTLGSLQAGQDQAAQAAQALATGQATDPTSVVMAVEKAQLQMQLASTLRNKAVEAVNDIFHTTV